MRWDKEKLTLPLIGPVYKNYLIVRTMSTFHLLSSAGVSIVKTMRLTGESSGNLVIRKLYSMISDDISHGNKISASMIDHDKDHTFFTPDIIQMVESAERTSTISNVASKISTQYRREVDFALANMVKYIEPIALLLA
jgi:MSHA biogenesis protein MshG